MLLLKVKQKDDAEFAKVREADTLKAYHDYMTSYPEGRHRAEVRVRMGELDKEAFFRAQSQDTLASYQDYLTAFPEGVYAVGGAGAQARAGCGQQGVRKGGIAGYGRGVPSLSRRQR